MCKNLRCAQSVLQVIRRSCIYTRTCNTGLWGVEAFIHLILTSALEEGDWSPSRLDRWNPVQ
jgi:hypothetical protein